MSMKRLCLFVLLMCCINKSYCQTLPPLCDVLNPIDLGSCLYSIERPANAEASPDQIQMFDSNFAISYSCVNDTYWDYTSSPKCSLCTSGEPTPDKSYCIQPSTCGANEVPLYEKGGIRLETVECFAYNTSKVNKVANSSDLIICDGDNMRYDSTVGNCVCDNGLTLYPNSYGYYTKKFCYTPLTNQITIRDTRFAIIGGTYQSKAISDLLDVSYSLCPNTEQPAKPEWCNALSNLCTLTNYYGNFQGNTICGASILKSSLSSTVRALSTDLDISNKVETSYSFKRGNNAAGSTHLRFGLASYTLNGTLLSFEELRNQFFYCSGESSVDEDLGSVWLRYGSGFNYKYKCDVSRLFNRQDNLFYDLYILNVQGGNVNGWTKVPIYNKELRGSDGNRVNTKGSESPTYVYRFTLFDNIGANTAAGVEAIRYAKDITIRVRARKDNKRIVINIYIDIERIYLPVVRIEYGEVTRANAGSEQFSINVEYETDLSTWNNFQTAWFWIFMVVMFFYWVYSYIRKQRNNARSTEEETLSFESIIRGIVLLISLAGPFCAGCYLAVFGTYWFCFFKFQDVPYVFLPPYINDVERHSNYYAFECILYVSTVCQIIRVIYLVYQQCTCDIFLIDWETPYDTYHIAEAKDDDAPQIPVSVWRKLFIANEFNELQTIRRTSFEFSLFFIWFLIEICGFKKMATQEPAFRDDPTIPVNIFLHCYMILFLWFMVTSLQLVWNYAIYQRFIEEPEESLFLDLCTVAKISLFIMDEKYHGYYFHCHLPGQHADTDMETLLQHLKMPGENLPGGKDSQVYEIFLSKNFKESYFHKFDDDLRSKMQQAGPMGGFFRAFPLCGNGRVPLDPKLVAKIEAFLKEYVEQNNCPVKRTIFEPFPMWKRMIHFPPDMSREEQCWWVPDSNSMLFSSRHSRLLFWGIEYDLMLFEALLWEITYYWWGNEALSATLTYLFTRLLYFFRNKFGEGNITMKTNVDGKFLI